MAEYQIEDDASIADDWVLWRRIHPLWLTSDTNPDRPALRPTGQNFKPNRNGSPVSAFLAHECGDPRVLLYGPHVEQYVAGFTVRHVRELGLGVRRVDPEEDRQAGDPVIPGHVEITGSPRHVEKLSRLCSWIIAPLSPTEP